MYSVIVPCYKSALTIRKVVELTSAKLDELGELRMSLFSWTIIPLTRERPSAHSELLLTNTALCQLSSLQRIPVSIMP